MEWWQGYQATRRTLKDCSVKEKQKFKKNRTKNKLRIESCIIK